MLPGSANVHADTYNGGIVGGTGSSWEDRTYPWENNRETHVNLKPNRSNLAEEGDRFYYRLEAGMPESEKASWRSEERRVGKECRAGWWRDADRHTEEVE